MSEYGFSLTCIFRYNDKTIDSILTRESTSRENPYSDKFDAASETMRIVGKSVKIEKLLKLWKMQQVTSDQS